MRKNKAQKIFQRLLKIPFEKKILDKKFYFLEKVLKNLKKTGFPPFLRNA